ncbi:MAG: response regulator transcription factor [Sphaerochaetaceae bacterium]|jgi:two-component system phosphate regulon response regulator PhoB|nr:response regulator transcription factor [Sphaerochaetaceae bacterium]MDC7237196.1 response regulator transcription factor [Sphaerochaetaceae bacterium]MDC7243890.1 response regulator transcription factor [Sphaerochaetaceae bacterium]MDC7249030.1 response regulator transcription factor [Sphaerochaetaceae bacterium]
MKNNILIIEDDKSISKLLSFQLQSEGFETECAYDGQSAINYISKNSYACIILDLMLPLVNGFEILKITRYKLEIKTPIIIASAKNDDSDIISALELGADDYLTKPFSPKVLSAKVKAALRLLDRKVDSQELKTIKDNGIFIDTSKRTCLIDDLPIILTATEFNLLALLIENPEKVYSREKLITKIKGSDYPVTERAIDVQIVALRKKLKHYGSRIKTVWGVGYKYLGAQN